MARENQDVSFPLSNLFSKMPHMMVSIYVKIIESPSKFTGFISPDQFTNVLIQ